MDQDHSSKPLCHNLLYLQHKRRKLKTQTRSCWVNPLNESRFRDGTFVNMFSKLRENEAEFVNYFRMSKLTFDKLLGRLSNVLKRKDTLLRDAVSPVERLAVTLRYFATGDTFTEIARTHRLGISTIRAIIHCTAEAICNILQPDCIPPLTKNSLASVAAGFEQHIQLPHCVGAIGGQRIRLKSCKSGSDDSILLMVVVDSRHRLLLIDVGSCGSNFDSTIFQNTPLWRNIENGCLPLPEPTRLGTLIADPVPYFFVGDQGFPLRHNLMRPFVGKGPLIPSKKVFNFRILRGRRFVQCTFAILSNKWKIFDKPLHVSKISALNIVQACCVLHNFVLVRDGYKFENTLEISGFEDIDDAPYLRGTKDAELARKTFTDYFCSEEGSVRWQPGGT